MNIPNNPDNFEQIVNAYQHAGANFILPASELREKLKHIKAFVFDWDGVFNIGHKGVTSPSPFGEPDISGITLMRFAYYKLTGSFPAIAIITGESNENALHLAGREHFNAIYMKVGNKAEAVEDLQKRLQIDAKEIGCFYDDYNDMPMTRVCGLRFMINKPSNLLYKSLMINEGWCDYITANIQPNNPIREITELIMGLLGQYKNCGISRAYADSDWTHFMSLRNQVKVDLYKKTPEGGFSLVMN